MPQLVQRVDLPLLRPLLRDLVSRCASHVWAYREELGEIPDISTIGVVDLKCPMQCTVKSIGELQRFGHYIPCRCWTIASKIL
jgi:hypothetical protein